MAEKAAPAAGSGSGAGVTAVVAALLANLGIAVAKFVGFLVTGASSMLAEAFHSVADTGNQTMLLFGSRLARREPDHKHPFGHGQVEGRCGATRAGGRSSGPPNSPSSPWCCWRTRPPSWA